MVPIAGIIFAVIGIQTYERSRRANLMQGRNRVPISELYADRFSRLRLSFECFGGLWFQVARVLHVDPELLRPEDRLDVLRCLPTWMISCLPVWSDIDDLDGIKPLAKPSVGKQESDIRTVEELVRNLA